MRCSSDSITRMSCARRGNQIGDAHQLLDRLDEAEVVGGRGDVVHAVRVRDALRIRHVLEQLLGPAMEVADDRLGLDDPLAVDLQKDPQHPVRRRMLGTEVLLHSWTSISCCGHRIITSLLPLSEFYFAASAINFFSIDSVSSSPGTHSVRSFVSPDAIAAA